MFLWWCWGRMGERELHNLAQTRACLYMPRLTDSQKIVSRRAISWEDGLVLMLGRRFYTLTSCRISDHFFQGTWLKIPLPWLGSLSNRVRPENSSKHTVQHGSAFGSIARQVDIVRLLLKLMCCHSNETSRTAKFWTITGNISGYRYGLGTALPSCSDCSSVSWPVNGSGMVINMRPPPSWCSLLKFFWFTYQCLLGPNLAEWLGNRLHQA